ncbi:LOW QUALITY PROTEIN: hypothetical protein PHMEG_0006867 [Phytophthora megakarya]|uniref:Uncharacterized protein n=1 Tax=Phytophthora megakarya TaxID=4795 RepID=A0A225WMV6_9STRA|nr:LOW QUALITY PROTEIN: hypothetical protein PHMEG_0006867 [Phytophthora megakarya]
MSAHPDTQYPASGPESPSGGTASSNRETPPVAPVVDMTSVDKPWTSLSVCQTMVSRPVCTNRRAKPSQWGRPRLLHPSLRRRNPQNVWPLRRPAGRVIALTDGTARGSCRSGGHDPGSSSACAGTDRRDDHPCCSRPGAARVATICPGIAGLVYLVIAWTGTRGARGFVFHGLGLASPPVPRQEGFNLGTFLTAFHATSSTHNLPPTDQPSGVPQRSVNTSDVAALRVEVVRLRQLLHVQPTHTPSRFATSEASVANTKSKWPPQPLGQVSCPSFPDAQGEYKPPQVHLLAAVFIPREGTSISAMNFVMAIREVESVKFATPPAVSMALFSGRLDSRGLTLLHFREALCTTPVRIKSKRVFRDISHVIHGLAAFSNELCYDHVRKLTSRLCAFVSTNMSVVPAISPARVRLTLPFANKLHGTAMVCLQSGTPHR